MKGIIPCKEMQTTTDNRLIAKKHHSTLSDLFNEAAQITAKTPQREICNLLSKTADYTSWNERRTADARKLQQKLSNCIRSQCSGCSDGFDELTTFLECANEDY